MSIAKKIRFIHSKLGWINTRKQLGSRLQITASGLAPFIAKAEEKVADKPAFANIIDSFFQKILLGGAHCVRVFSVSEGTEPQIESIFSQAVEENEFTATYPLPLEKPELENAPMSVTLVEKQEIEFNDSSFPVNIYCNKAYFTSTDKLEPSFLNDDGIELLNDGALITCKKRHTVQCYSFVFYDKIKKQLILGVDVSQLPRAEVGKVFSSLVNHITPMYRIRLKTAQNYFSAVQPLYTNRDGFVTSVGFLTPDGNTSGMRAKKAESCLKVDSYHKGGEDAAKVLTKFRLTKAWKIENDDTENFISISLPGNKFMLNDPLKKLDELCTQDCLGLTDIIFMIDKVRNAAK